jgi:3-hydroxyisobutyrate dehydrogenase-like beta-hydroxyacid dehydrogenase
VEYDATADHRIIGIGVMGWHMATNLCRGGHPVIVYDSNKEQQQKSCRRSNAAAPPRSSKSEPNPTS